MLRRKMSAKIEVNKGVEDDKGKPITKFSASSIKTYESCGLKYYYNYITKEERKEWSHLVLGNFCHLVLELFHKKYAKSGLKGYKSLNNLMSACFAQARKRKQYRDASNILLAEAKDLLNDYLKVVSVSGMPIVKGVEKKFDIDLSDTVKVRGIIDRIDILKDGQFHIVDYKTTKKQRYLEPFQLLVYGSWLLQEYPKTKTFKASYVLLRHNSALKSYTFNREDVEDCERTILDYAKKINRSVKDDQWVPVPSPLCRWCDFQTICPTQAGW